MLLLLEALMMYLLSSEEMDTTTRVQIRDEADCSLHSSKTLGKGINPFSLPPTMDKWEERLDSLSLDSDVSFSKTDCQISLGEGNV